MENEVPKSLIESCRQAEPAPEEQGKYSPELFDASAFQFKGPLVIEYPKLHILEHDLTNIKPDGSNINEHVQFDKNLNVAYNIGENVEIIVKNYGQGTKGGSAEMIKDGGEEDEETSNEENDSKQSIIENDKKEMAKHLKMKTTQMQDKKFEKKIEQTEKTQPSRYSESSTQTLKISDETTAENPAKYNEAKILASKKKSKSLRKKASTILFGQISQTPVRLRTIMSINKQRDIPSSTDTTNIITSTTPTTKSQHFTADDTNASVTGSTESEVKVATYPKGCDQS